MRICNLKYIFSFFCTLLTCQGLLFRAAQAQNNSPLQTLPAKQLASPVYMRIFKEEHILEIWTKSAHGYQLHKSYKICKWSGKLGPKQVEGDRQSPEGFYTLTSGQMGWYAHKWRRSFNIGFPNNYDIAIKRSGTNLLIHGGCKSIGCYAMTNKNMDEIYDFIATRVENGIKEIPLHIFPFRMTEANLQRHIASPWISFWRTLQPAYALFEQNHTPPAIRICSGKYDIRHAVNSIKNWRHASKSHTLSLLSRENNWLNYVKKASLVPIAHKENPAQSSRCQPVQAQWVRNRQARHPAPRRNNNLLFPATANELAYQGKRIHPRLRRYARQFVVKCNIKLPSCRRWVFLKSRRLRNKKSYRRTRGRRRRTVNRHRFRSYRKRRHVRRRR